MNSNPSSAKEPKIWGVVIPGTGEDIVQYREDRVNEYAEMEELADLKKNLKFPRVQAEIFNDEYNLIYDKLMTKIEKIAKLKDNNVLIDEDMKDISNFINELRLLQLYIKHVLDNPENTSYTDDLMKVINLIEEVPLMLALVGVEEELLKKIEFPFAKEGVINEKEIFKIEDKLFNLMIEKDRDNFNYDPPKNLQRSYDIRMTTLQGVGTHKINPANMKNASGAQKLLKNPLAKVSGILFGSGEEENINYFMAQLEKATSKPDRIVLTGHSRGACSAIELARKIYLQYGNDIKIVMNLSDPVPGPGNFTESKRVIPPNVDSLTIIYDTKESNIFHLPLDINKLCFNPNTTTVTAIPNEVKHGGSLGLLKKINDLSYQCLLEKDIEENNIVKINHKLAPTVHEGAQGIGVRNKCQFNCATNPKQNTLSSGLKKLHSALQSNIYKGKKDEYHRVYQNKQPSIEGDSPKSRKKILQNMYRDKNIYFSTISFISKKVSQVSSFFRKKEENPSKSNDKKSSSQKKLNL